MNGDLQKLIMILVHVCAKTQLNVHTIDQHSNLRKNLMIFDSELQTKWKIIIILPVCTCMSL